MMRTKIFPYLTNKLINTVKGTSITTCSRYRSTFQSNKPTSQGSPFDKKVSLVIFDKDGTLVEFGQGWTIATTNFAKRLEMATGLHLEHTILEFLGYDHDNQTWREGLLCDNPQRIRDEIHGFLKNHGVSDSQANHLLDSHYRDDHFLPDYNTIQEIDNPLAIFKTLNHYNIKVAICTSDTRLSTYHLFSKVNLARYTDYVLCGDDQHFRVKPDPMNIYHICDELNVTPAETVMIGDTIRDVKMGKSAQVHSSIGVLSGVCDRNDLSHSADFIVPSLKHSMEFYLPPGHEDIYEKHL